MKKLDNFSNCLNILRTADFEMANNNNILRVRALSGVERDFVEIIKELEHKVR